MEAGAEQSSRRNASLHCEVIIVVLAYSAVRKVTWTAVVDQRRIYLGRRSGRNQACIRMNPRHSSVCAVRHDDRNARGEVIRRRTEITTKSLDAAIGVAVLLIGVIVDSATGADDSFRSNLPGE